MSYRTNDPLGTISGDLSGNEATATVISITGQSGTVNISSTGNVITWAAATTAPGITQLTPTSDAATNNLTLQAQNAFATASTNITGGNLILEGGAGATSNATFAPGNVIAYLNVPSSGGTEGYLQVSRAGTNVVQIGAQTGSTGKGAIYFGNVTPSNSNYAFTSDGTNLVINTPGAGSTQFQAASAANVTLTSGLYQWGKGVATPTFNQLAQTTDTATNNLTIQAQNAEPAAVTNLTGGNLVLSPGAGATTNGSPGKIIVNIPALTGTGSAGYVALDNTGTGHYATTGILNLPNSTGIYERNAANSADMLLISADGTNSIQIGDATVPSNLDFKINGSGSYAFFQSGTIYALMNAFHNSFIAPLAGLNNGPLSLQATSGAISTASNIVLSSAQIMTPVIQLDGTISVSNCTITLPNIIGGFWYFDLTGVTFGGHSLIFTTGSGTSATVSSIGLTGQYLLTVCVVASNFVSVGGA